MDIGQQDDAVDESGVFLEDFFESALGICEVFGLGLVARFFELFVDLRDKGDTGSVDFAKGKWALQ